MEIVKILRELVHRRRLVGLVALAALVVGVLLTYRISLPPESRMYEVGIATARILVDTPKSVVVEVNPRGADTLGERSSVIASLMAEGDVKAAIARRAGLRPKQLLAAAESAIEPITVKPSEADDPEAHLLTVGVVINPDGAQLPIIKVEAQAPDARGATKLANASVTGLRDYLDSKAAAEEISDARRLQVSALGAAQAREQVRGPGRAIALAAVFFVFVTGCVAILLASALARGWRQAAASEDGDLVDASPEDAPFDESFTDGDLDLFSSEAESADVWADLPADAIVLPASATNGDSNGDRKARAKSA